MFFVTFVGLHVYLLDTQMC